MQPEDINQLSALKKETIELLSAVGVEDLFSLVQSQSDELHEELLKANEYLELVQEVPSEKEIRNWLNEAHKITGKKSDLTAKPLKEVMPMAKSLPIALAVGRAYVSKHSIRVEDVPVMEDLVEECELEEYALNFAKEARDTAREANKKSDTSVSKVTSKRPPEKTPTPIEKIDESERDRKDRPAVEPLKRNTGFDIRKTPSPELNAGKKLHSRSYVRGVLHPQTGRVRFATFITFITFILFLLSFLAGGLVLASALTSIEVSIWLLAIPVAFLFFGVLYLAIAKPMKCRICGQPLFSSKGCFKHVKAHKIPMLGYIFPTCMHILLFHWFRCIYCGTSVRLKE